MSQEKQFDKSCRDELTKLVEAVEKWDEDDSNDGPDDLTMIDTCVKARAFLDASPVQESWEGYHHDRETTRSHVAPKQTFHERMRELPPEPNAGGSADRVCQPQPGSEHQSAPCTPSTTRRIDAGMLKAALIWGLHTGVVERGDFERIAISGAFNLNTVAEYLDGKLSVASATPRSEEIPLCSGHAESWFCGRDHLPGDLDCVVCAFVNLRRPDGGKQTDG